MGAFHTKVVPVKECKQRMEYIHAAELTSNKHHTRHRRLSFSPRGVYVSTTAISPKDMILYIDETQKMKPSTDDNKT